MDIEEMKGCQVRRQFVGEIDVVVFKKVGC